MSRNYMYMNVILSFKSLNEYGETQEFFDLHLPVNKKEKDAATFLTNKLFKRIAAKCEQYGRKKEDLYKISTASNWGLFKDVTGKESLCDIGHNCKWYFNDDVNELDSWEMYLKNKYNFGKNIY